jgi:hypothetical protein
MDKLQRWAWIDMIEDAASGGGWYIRRRYGTGKSYYFHLGHRHRRGVVVRISDHKGNRRSGETLMNVVSDSSLTATMGYLMRRPKREGKVRPTPRKRR